MSEPNFGMLNSNSLSDSVNFNDMALLPLNHHFSHILTFNLLKIALQTVCSSVLKLKYNDIFIHFYDRILIFNTELTQTKSI